MNVRRPRARRGKRNIRRRPRGAPKKGLVRMIKQVALRTEETKRFTLASSTRISNNTLYTLNLMYNIYQGAADNQFIGDKVRVMGVAINWHYAGDKWVSGGDNYPQDCYLQMGLIQSRRELYNVLNPQVFNSAVQTDFLVNPGDWGMLTRFDNNKCKVVRKKETNYKCPDKTTPPCGTGTLYVPINRDWQFTGGSSGLGRFYNYYITLQGTNIISYNTTSGNFSQSGVVDIGKLDYSITMYYKDS